MFDVTHPPVWPKELTDEDWQKKKGGIAKIAGETGIGAALDHAKMAYDQVKISAGGMERLPAQELDKAWERLGKLIHAAIVELVKVETLAKQVETKWKANKLIPSASVKAVQGVGAKAKQFHETVQHEYDARLAFMKRFETGKA